jgi:enoyl-CoA hydratase/carnithine racemase
MLFSWSHEEDPMNDRVKITYEGATAFVALQRPDKHNGIDIPMLRGVLDAQATLRKERDVRAVVLHGLGPSFCAGLDFKSVFAKPVQASLMTTQIWWPQRNEFQRWSVGWRELGVPVIAVVHGSVFGGGLQLALGADIRIGAPDAKLSVMEAKWGLVPDMGGAALLRELLPIDVAKELTMTGRIVDAVQAKALGLLTHLSDDPMEHAKRLAAEIETRSPDAVAASKFLLQDAWNVTDEDEALAAERRWQRRIIGRENQRISVTNNQKRESRPFSRRRVG